MIISLSVYIEIVLLLLFYIIIDTASDGSGPKSRSGPELARGIFQFPDVVPHASGKKRKSHPPHPHSHCSVLIIHALSSPSLLLLLLLRGVRISNYNSGRALHQKIRYFSSAHTLYMYRKVSQRKCKKKVK